VTNRYEAPKLYVTTEDQHVALPKLYGAPAYARPPKIVEETARPLDPDELPLAAVQTEEERRLADLLEEARASGMAPIVARAGSANPAYRPPKSGNGKALAGHAAVLLGRPFRLRSLADRLRRSGR
jgi:hypothetical protein